MSGAIAGMGFSVVGHPLDTLKTRMQADLRYRSTLHCAIITARREGLLAFFKGLSPSLVMGVTTSAIRFGVQARFNAMLAQYMRTGEFHCLNLSTRVASEAAGGFVAGLVLPHLYTPLELVKSRQQANEANGQRLSMFKTMRDVSRKEGVRGIYVGHSLTVLRSSFGNASLFGSYELVKDLLSKVLQSDSIFQRPLSGIFAGCFSWFVVFPIDTAKTRMQLAGAVGCPKDFRKISIYTAFQQLRREGALYRGFGPTLVRAVPVHMAYLPVFDVVMTMLETHCPRG